MKDFLLRFFTWWSGTTFGTAHYTRRHGELVGEDAFGNRYYQTRGGKVDPGIGVVRRWVLYKGEVEATKVPPGWLGWLRGTTDVAPSQESYTPRAWQEEHRPNMTGTALAYRPRGSILAQGERPAATGDYKPWTPGG